MSNLKLYELTLRESQSREYPRFDILLYQEGTTEDKHNIVCIKLLDLDLMTFCKMLLIIGISENWLFMKLLNTRILKAQIPLFKENSMTSNSISIFNLTPNLTMQ